MGKTDTASVSDTTFKVEDGILLMVESIQMHNQRQHYLQCNESRLNNQKK